MTAARLRVLRGCSGHLAEMSTFYVDIFCPCLQILKVPDSMELPQYYCSFETEFREFRGCSLLTNIQQLNHMGIYSKAICHQRSHFCSSDPLPSFAGCLLSLACCTSVDCSDDFEHGLDRLLQVLSRSWKKRRPHLGSLRMLCL